MNNATILNLTTYLKMTLTTCIFLAFMSLTTAQSTAPSRLLASNDLSPKGIITEEWSYFYDAENKIYYIDFETINLNLSTVEVTNQDGKTVISDKVADLPVNTIYELDCSKLGSGEYTIELHSYTDVLKKKVTLK